jgi:serine/threonine protein phosphatase PrpC
MATKDGHVFSSVKGEKRDTNKDYLLVIDESDYSIFAVFDGVSSAIGGGEAAKNAAAFIKSNYKKYLGDEINLKQLMHDANTHLLEAGIKQPFTTFCLVHVNKTSKFYTYSWLGDSRLYIISNQFMEQITIDDNLSENVLTKCLGDPQLHITDFRQEESPKKNLHLLLCTDGFSRIMEKERLVFFEVFQKKSLRAISEKINSLIKGKNIDDSTFIFVK